MSSIVISLGKDVSIDCQKLCEQIQQLIVNNFKEPGEKLLYISINDVINLPEPILKIEDTSNCIS